MQYSATDSTWSVLLTGVPCRSLGEHHPRRRTPPQGFRQAEFITIISSLQQNPYKQLRQPQPLQQENPVLAEGKCRQMVEIARSGEGSKEISLD
ncbi:hypothetical protein RRG08_000742 [Elysia crispata]|uniref:Uncharacterized protein n=1 Tax=Elysia crispata TaxID=231223 RepID=A0AAE1DWQ1_9GAST|nr:hypothetical protein RRG08_000742 [Elysia crispata]